MQGGGIRAGTARTPNTGIRAARIEQPLPIRLTRELSAAIDAIDSYAAGTSVPWTLNENSF